MATTDRYSTVIPNNGLHYQHLKAALTGPKFGPKILELFGRRDGLEEFVTTAVLPILLDINDAGATLRSLQTMQTNADHVSIMKYLFRLRRETLRTVHDPNVFNVDTAAGKSESMAEGVSNAHMLT